MGEAAALKLQMELVEAMAESHLTGLGLLFFFSLSGTGGEGALLQAGLDRALSELVLERGNRCS